MKELLCGPGQLTQGPETMTSKHPNLGSRVIFLHHGLTNTFCVGQRDKLIPNLDFARCIR